MIGKNNFENYIRDIIRRDNVFVFSHILLDYYTPLKKSNGTPFDSSTKLPVTNSNVAPRERPILNHHGYKSIGKIKNYIYKNIMYKNYYYFLTDYCIKNNSIKCRTELNEFLKEQGLCQNRHKKNSCIHIRWKY
jgi:hypothetical protein